MGASRSWGRPELGGPEPGESRAGGVQSREYPQPEGVQSWGHPETGASRAGEHQELGASSPRSEVEGDALS